jgi:hypothetical protein
MVWLISYYKFKELTVYSHYRLLMGLIYPFPRLLAVPIITPLQSVVMLLGGFWILKMKSL